MNRSPRAGALCAALAAAAFLGGCVSPAPRPLPLSPGPRAQVPPWLLPRGGKGFAEELGAALAKLRATKAGALLLSKIDGSGAAVVIRERHLPSGVAGGAVVWWNPRFSAPESPSFVTLHHELVHVFQDARASLAKGPWQEAEAIGLDEFADVAYSENSLRRELGLPLRTSHRELPGMSPEDLRRMYHAAYTREGAARRELETPGPPGWRARPIELEAPAGLEEEAR